MCLQLKNGSIKARRLAATQHPQLLETVQSLEIEGGKIIVYSFRSPYFLDAAIDSEKEFRTSELSVVIESH